MANVEAGAAMLAIELAWSPRPREMRTASLRLAEGATIADALRASGWPELAAAAAAGDADADAQPDARASAPFSTAVWGQARPLAAKLRDGDRVEVLRALEVAPMEARRARYEAAGGVKALRQRKHAMQPVKARRG